MKKILLVLGLLLLWPLLLSLLYLANMKLDQFPISVHAAIYGVIIYGIIQIRYLKKKSKKAHTGSRTRYSGAVLKEFQEQAGINAMRSTNASKINSFLASKIGITRWNWASDTSTDKIRFIDEENEVVEAKIYYSKDGEITMFRCVNHRDMFGVRKRKMFLSNTSPATLKNTSLQDMVR